MMLKIYIILHLTNNDTQKANKTKFNNLYGTTLTNPY